MALTLFPTPDAEGIAKTKEIFLRKYGRTISDDEATRVLGGLMRYMYLIRYLDEQVKEQWEAPAADVSAAQGIPT